MTFQQVQIGTVFDVHNGATPSSNVPHFWNGEIPWICPADLGQLTTRFISFGMRNITKSGYESCGTSMVPKGTIILSTRAPIGHLAIASDALCFNQGCRGLVPRSSIDSGFAFYSLTTIKPRLEAEGQGSTFIELSRDKLRAVRIPLPTLIDQKSIAKFLDHETARIDELIKKKQRIVKLLQEKRFSLLREGVACRVHKKFGKVHFEQTSLRWLVQNLDNFRIPLNSEERAERQGQYPYWGANGIVDYLNEYLIDDRVVLVGEDGAPFFERHKPVAFISDGPIWPNNHIHILKPHASKLNDRFLCHFLNQVDYRKYINGSTRDKLTQAQLGSVQLTFPELTIQESIANYLDERVTKLEKMKSKIVTSINSLLEYRSSLISLAVTGKIDLPNWHKQGNRERQLDQLVEK